MTAFLITIARLWHRSNKLPPEISHFPTEQAFYRRVRKPTCSVGAFEFGRWLDFISG
jgi:hypothetical protein